MPLIPDNLDEPDVPLCEDNAGELETQHHIHHQLRRMTLLLHLIYEELAKIKDKL